MPVFTLRDSCVVGDETGGAIRVRHGFFLADCVRQAWVLAFIPQLWGGPSQKNIKKLQVMLMRLFTQKTYKNIIGSNYQYRPTIPETGYLICLN
jgi:hypothetical protein